MVNLTGYGSFVFFVNLAQKYIMRRIIGIVFLTTVAISSCKKLVTEDYPEFVGIWENNTTTINIESGGRGSYDYYYSNGYATTSKHIDGKVRIKDDELYIGGGIVLRKKFYINTYPTTIQVDFYAYNTFIVLDGDTLYKYPYHEINYDFLCQNGIKDAFEEDVDCGGRCNACETCDDHIMNQDETGVDCGGVCNSCPVSPCLDSLSVNTSFLKYCLPNTFPSSYNDNFSYLYASSGTLNEFTLYAGGSNNFSIEIAFPKKPEGTMIYNLNPYFYDIGGYSEYNDASVKYEQFTYGLVYKSVGGQLYVWVEDSVMTISFCNIEFEESSYSICAHSSARLEYEL